jgi:hypothetical protein
LKTAPKPPRLPMLRIEPTEPTLPIEATHPADPIEATQPAEPMETIEPAEPMEAIEPAEPMEAMEPADPMDAIESADPSGRTEWSVRIDWTDPAVLSGGDVMRRSSSPARPVRARLPAPRHRRVDRPRTLTFCTRL